MNILDTFDKVVSDAAEKGMKVSESIALVADLVDADPEGFDLPPQSELVRAYVASTIRDERNSRARRRATIFEAVRAALADLSTLGAEEPWLDLAMRTGTSDGEDKVMRYWSAADWLDVLAASARHVEDAVGADRDLRDLVNPIILAYTTHTATSLGDMLAAPDAS